MKVLKYWVQYLAVVSLLFMTFSGIYDMIAGVRATSWYLHWHEAHYGPAAVSSVVFSYVLGQVRGISAAFGCGFAGLMQVRKGRVKIGYLLFLAFWTSQYVLAVVDKAYKGINPSDAVQMAIALFCLASMVLYKAAHHAPTLRESSQSGR